MAIEGWVAIETAFEDLNIGTMTVIYRQIALVAAECSAAASFLMVQFPVSFVATSSQCLPLSSSPALCRESRIAEPTWVGIAQVVIYNGTDVCIIWY